MMKTLHERIIDVVSIAIGELLHNSNVIPDSFFENLTTNIESIYATQPASEQGEELDKQLRVLISEGRKIQATKLYKDTTWKTLKQSIDYIRSFSPQPEPTDFREKVMKLFIDSEEEFYKPEVERIINAICSLLPDVTEEIINTKIDEITDLHRYKVSGYPDSYGSYSEGWSDACDILGEAILDLFRKEGR